MKKIVNSLIVLLILFVGCSKTQKIKRYELEPKYIWNLKKIEQTNSVNCIGIYNNEIYYLKRDNDDYIVSFVSIKGDIVNEFKIPYGKGPGEMVNNQIIKVKNNKVYVSDISLCKLMIFNKTGEYLDVIKYDRNTGYIDTFDIYKDFLYFHSYNKIFLGKMSIKDGKIIKKVKYDKKVKPMKIGDLYKGKTMCIDSFTGNINLGYKSKPYRIKVYNKSLEKINRIQNSNLTNNYNELKISPKGLSGDMIVTKINYDNKFLYTPLVAGSYSYKNKDLKKNKIKPTIIVLDKSDKKIEAKIRIQRLEKLKCFFNIIGVSKNYIFIHMNDEKGVFQKKYNKNYENDQVIMVFKKPQDLI